MAQICHTDGMVQMWESEDGTLTLWGQRADGHAVYLSIPKAKIPKTAIMTWSEEVEGVAIDGTAEPKGEATKRLVTPEERRDAHDRLNVALDGSAPVILVDFPKGTPEPARRSIERAIHDALWNGFRIEIEYDRDTGNHVVRALDRGLARRLAGLLRPTLDPAERFEDTTHPDGIPPERQEPEPMPGHPSGMGTTDLHEKDLARRKRDLALWIKVEKSIRAHIQQPIQVIARFAEQECPGVAVRELTVHDRRTIVFTLPDGAVTT